VLAFFFAMLFATILFWLARKSYVRIAAIRLPKGDVLATLRDDLLTVPRLLPILLPIPLFWALYYEQTSTWLNQSLTMSERLFGISVPPQVIFYMQDFFIIVQIPLFELLIYPKLANSMLHRFTF
jgi:dipeptide/tripeptide permease